MDDKQGFFFQTMTIKKLKVSKKKVVEDIQALCLLFFEGVVHWLVFQFCVPESPVNTAHSAFSTNSEIGMVVIFWGGEGLPFYCPGNLRNGVFL